MPERPPTIPVTRGEQIVGTVEAFGDGPDGILRVDRYVIFVPEVIPGESVRVEIVSAGRKHGRGVLLEVLEASPQRAEPRCVHFGTCGGCQLQHLSHPAQMTVKEDRLRRTLAHAMEVSVESLPMRPMRGPADPWEQRTKLALHFAERDGVLEAGYFSRRSRDVVGIVECPIQAPLALKIGLAIRDGARRAKLSVYDERARRGHLRAALVRVAAGTTAAHATVILQTSRGLPPLDPIVDAARQAGATGVSVNLNDGPPEILLGEEFHTLWGEPHVLDEIDGLRLRSSPGAFFQTSAFGVRALLEEVRRTLVDAPRDARIVDLYCGGGLFALAMADRVARVFGVEDSEQAIADAQSSADSNGFTNTHFRAGRVETMIRGLARNREKPYAVILDPPRAGCDEAVIHGVAEELQPLRVVYVSCDPATLARDLARLVACGYVLQELTPVDMFPHTSHIEAVAVLDRARRREDPTARRLFERLRSGTADRGGDS